jgi:hypothetical protein
MPGLLHLYSLSSPQSFLRSLLPKDSVEEMPPLTKQFLIDPCQKCSLPTIEKPFYYGAQSMMGLPMVFRFSSSSWACSTSSSRYRPET